MALAQIYKNPLRDIASQAADIVGKKQLININAMKMGAMKKEAEDATSLKAAWDAAGGDLTKFMETEGHRFTPQQNAAIQQAAEKKQAAAAQRSGFQDYATGGAYAEGQMGPTQGAAQAMQAFDLGGGDAIAKSMVDEMYPGDTDGFTLGAGQTRYGPGGEVIASAPAKSSAQGWKALPTGKGLYKAETGETMMFPADAAGEDESYTYKPGADGFMWALPKSGGPPKKTAMKVPTDDKMVKITVPGDGGKPITKMVPQSELMGEGVQTYERERKDKPVDVIRPDGIRDILWLAEGESLPEGYKKAERTPADVQKWERIRSLEDKKGLNIASTTELEELTNLRAKLKMGTKKTWSTLDPKGNPILKMMDFETDEERTILAGDRIKFTNGERANYRQEYEAQLDQVTRLGEISRLYKPEFSNYWNRTEEGVMSFINKSFPSEEDRNRETQGYFEWRRGVEEAFNSYRKIVTGAQASDAELVKLQKAFITGSMSQNQFEAHMRGIQTMAQTVLERKKWILANDSMPTEEQNKEFMRKGQEAGTKMTYKMFIGEELTERDIKDAMRETGGDRAAAIQLIQDSLY